MLSYVDLIGLPSRDITYQIIKIKSSKLIREKIENILNAEYEKQEFQLQTFKNKIAFNHVSFKYDDNDQLVFDDINVEFLMGKKYAIIGRSGSGKTTLKNLLLGHLEWFEGSIKYDDVDINKVDTDTICTSLGQSTFIFNASAIDNITLFGSYSSDDLETLVKDLSAEKILKSDLGEFENKISGGEKRKIDLLRSFSRNPKIFVGDEVFENLGAKSEQKNKKFH